MIGRATPSERVRNSGTSPYKFCSSSPRPGYTEEAARTPAARYRDVTTPTRGIGRRDQSAVVRGGSQDSAIRSADPTVRSTYSPTSVPTTTFPWMGAMYSTS